MKPKLEEIKQLLEEGADKAQYNNVRITLKGYIDKCTRALSNLKMNKEDISKELNNIDSAIKKISNTELIKVSTLNDKDIMPYNEFIDQQLNKIKNELENLKGIYNNISDSLALISKGLNLSKVDDKSNYTYAEPSIKF
jgi:hypothetical protein